MKISSTNAARLKTKLSENLKKISTILSKELFEKDSYTSLRCNKVLKNNTARVNEER